MQTKSFYTQSQYARIGKIFSRPVIKTKYAALSLLRSLMSSSNLK